MSKTEEKLLDRARRQFGSIQPCSGKTLSQCFYYQNGCLQFWFNDTRRQHAPGVRKHADSSQGAIAR